MRSGSPTSAREGLNPVAMLAHNPLLLIRSCLSKIKLDEGDPLAVFVVI